jgi:hypothetical protein
MATQSLIAQKTRGGIQRGGDLEQYSIFVDVMNPELQLGGEAPQYGLWLPESLPEQVRCLIDSGFFDADYAGDGYFIPVPPCPHTGSFTPENLVYTKFDNPEAATWALLDKTSPGFDTSQLEGATIDVTINGVLYSVSGQDAIDQIGKYGGVLVDYDEGLFQTETLSVGTSVTDRDSKAISEQEGSVTNWAYVGVVKMPLNAHTGEHILRAEKLQVIELDDLDPTAGTQTSFESGPIGEQYFLEDGTIVCGVRNNDANAIDIGYENAFDYASAIPVLFSVEVEIRNYNWWHTPDGRIETNCQFDPGVRVLLLNEGVPHIVGLVWRIGHLNIAPESTPLYAQIMNGTLTSIPPNTVFGVMQHEEECPPCYAVANIGVYADYCAEEGCDWQHPSHDSNALVLPAAMFFSPDDRDLVLESNRSCR